MNSCFRHTVCQPHGKPKLCNSRWNIQIFVDFSKTNITSERCGFSLSVQVLCFSLSSRRERVNWMSPPTHYVGQSVAQLKPPCLSQMDSFAYQRSGAELLQEPGWGSNRSVVLHHWPWATLRKLQHPTVQRRYDFNRMKNWRTRSWNVIQKI